MLSAALYLLERSLLNRGRRLLGQLRSPRYVIALLAGLGYLALVLLGHRGERGATVPAGMLESGGTLLLLFLVLKWWLLGADRLALAFTPAEIQFLFAAPVSRPALLGYKLGRAQLVILLNVLIWSVLLRAGAESGPGRWLHAGSLWLFFSLISLHRLGVALTRSTVVEHGVSGLRRAVVPILLFALGAAAAWITIAGFEPAGEEPLEALRQLLATPPLAWVLYPFHLPLLPFGATTAGDWLPRAAVVLGIVGLHLVWIFRADRAFEEASVAASARRAARLERWRRHGAAGGSVAPTRRRWVPLAPNGHPAVAIAWKQLTRLVRTVSSGFALFMAALLLGGIGVGLATVHEDPFLLTMAGTLALSWTAILVLFGPFWVRADIRSDLDHLATLRTWPLAGQVIMAGQVLGSVVVLTLLEVLLGLASIIALKGTGSLATGGLFLGAAFLAALPLLALVNVLAISLQNAGALLFPSWIRVEVRPGGIEATGQQILTAGVSLILLGLLLVGPAALAGLFAYLLYDGMGGWAFIVASPVAGLGLALEAYLFVDWLGFRFERLDPSEA